MRIGLRWGTEQAPYSVHKATHKATPLSESASAVRLDDEAGAETAFVIEVVEDRRRHRGAIRQLSEAEGGRGGVARPSIATGRPKKLSRRPVAGDW